MATEKVTLIGGPSDGEVREVETNRYQYQTTNIEDVFKANNIECDYYDFCVLRGVRYLVYVPHISAPYEKVKK